MGFLLYVVTVNGFRLGLLFMFVCFGVCVLLVDDLYWLTVWLGGFVLFVLIVDCLFGFYSCL